MVVRVADQVSLLRTLLLTNFLFTSAFALVLVINSQEKAICDRKF